MLVFISGLSGAGKTTLIGAALWSMPSVSYLRTVTTRAHREGEAGSFQYQFVSKDEYQQLRSQSKEWDHTEYGGYWYGADVEAVRGSLDRGTNTICSIAPDAQVLEDMSRLYGVRPVTVWIDTPEQIAKARIKDDTERSRRTEDAMVRTRFGHVFTPVGDIGQDERAFIGLIQRIIDSRSQ